MIKQGAAYNAQTEMLRIGDLNGNWGYAAEAYGAAFGEYAAGKANIVIEGAFGIFLRTHNIVKIMLQPDGDIFIGEDVSAPATTNFAIFTNAQAYNGEAMAAGDFLIGDNSAAKANMFWDKSDGELEFRGGQTMQVKIGTSGAVTFGAGVGRPG